MEWAKRLSPLACSIALVLSACAANPPAPGDASPTARAAACAAGKRCSPTPGTSASQGASAHRTPKASPGSTTTQTGPASYADHGGVGEMARAYLRAVPATKLEVEVAYVKGATPSQGALDHLETILRRDTKKNVVVSLGAQIPNAQSTYTFEDIQRLSARYRAGHSGGATATAWLVYLNGSLAGGSGVLGVAYEASEIAMFPDEMARAETALVDRAAIERSVVVHEFGHILGLVNIGYVSRFDHEDAQHPHHSKYRTSVMYWAIEDISIAVLLNGGPPDDFDQYDEADLASLRAG